MAQIEKRIHPTGAISYRARIRIRGLPEESATFPTRTSAKEWALLRENELKNNRYLPSKKTFSHFISLYFEKFNPKQKQHLTYWNSKLGKYYLSHITPSLIASARDELLNQLTPRKTLRSPSTVNRYLATLSKAFSICIKELNWLKENPTLLISHPKESKPRERYLTLDEISRLLDACRYSRSPYLYPIVVFALSTGARRGEILNLKWNDLNFQNSIATFRHTKNGDSRTVSLTPYLLECLHKERTRRLTLSPYIFPDKSGQQPADIETAWSYATRKANLKIRFHDLRHTAASHLAMSGASTLEIAAILGHKTLAMVKRYSHLSTSATAKALNRMNEIIFGT